MNCAEPGCGGTVVAGYCDLCGTAPAPGAGPEPAATAPAGSPAARSTRTVRTGSSRSASARGRLGAGVVTIPPVPRGDPAAAILTDPQVPERNRFCGNPECRNPVGRGNDGQPGRAEGFCGQCGTPYSVCSQPLSWRPGRRPVRSARLYRARRPRLDLPGDRPQRERSLGGTQGSDQLRRCGRDGHRGSRGAGSRRGRASEHRPNPQLRRACRFHRCPGRLHRDGIHRRHLPQTDPQSTRCAPATGPGGRLYRRDRTGTGLSAHPGIRLLRLQTR